MTSHPKGCLLRKYKIVETYTVFSAEFVVPLLGFIVVAFNDAVTVPSMPGELLPEKVWRLPVQELLQIAKVRASPVNGLSMFLPM